MFNELKIRIWDNEQGCYLNGITNLYDCMFNDGGYYTHCSEVEENKKRYIIERFTGITSLVSGDIYEGDITKEGTVEWRTDLHWDGGGSSHPGFYFAKHDYEMEYHDRLDENCEVIGNIHKDMI
jgi:hypothetical protein